jgi:hypothetical protein
MRTQKKVTVALYVDNEWKEFNYDYGTQELYDVIRLVNHEQLKYKIIYR